MAAKNYLFELKAVEVLPVNKNTRRKWKLDFSVQEIAMITQKFEENQAVLESVEQVVIKVKISFSIVYIGRIQRKSESTTMLFCWFCNTSF